MDVSLFKERLRLPSNFLKNQNVLEVKPREFGFPPQI